MFQYVINQTVGLCFCGIHEAIPIGIFRDLLDCLPSVMCKLRVQFLSNLQYFLRVNINIGCLSRISQAVDESSSGNLEAANVFLLRRL